MRSEADRGPVRQFPLCGVGRPRCHAGPMDEREGGRWTVLPGIAPQEDGAPAAQLECDDEIFELRPDEFGGTHYSWLSGPNPGYGFSMSPTGDDDVEQHQTNIRGFLSMIDPRTGYIEED
jgi:hypothetical protein